MVCAVVSFSVINQHLDFSFNRDRYGLMYVFFALLGWGGIVRNNRRQTGGDAANDKLG
jgi:hypothetical protein